MTAVIVNGIIRQYSECRRRLIKNYKTVVKEGISIPFLHSCFYVCAIIFAKTSEPF